MRGPWAPGPADRVRLPEGQCIGEDGLEPKEPLDLAHVVALDLRRAGVRVCVRARARVCE